MDLMGTGDDGLMVVNGKVFEKEYELLSDINKKNDYFPQIKKNALDQLQKHRFRD